jgi:uncharacterized membrane protein
MLRRKWKLLGGALVIAIAVTYTMAGERCTVLTGTDVLNIDLGGIPSGSAQKFGYTDDAGRKIRFVLARGSDGKVRAVFDACRQCYSFHKGYAISGGELVCRVCGNHYPIERMTTGKASCVPVSVDHRDHGRTATVRVSDVIAGRWLF